MAIASVQDNRRYDHSPHTGLYMARMGSTVCLKGNDKDTLSAGVVQTTAGEFSAIPEGSAIVLTCFYMHLSTASDWVTMEIGYTSAADGTGDFVAATPKFRIDTGDKKTGTAPSMVAFDPPMHISYSVTSKAVAVKLTTNDDSATVTFGVNGWLEEIPS